MAIGNELMQVFSETLAHGNSKNQIRNRREACLRKEVKRVRKEKARRPIILYIIGRIDNRLYHQIYEVMI